MPLGLRANGAREHGLVVSEATNSPSVTPGPSPSPCRRPTIPPPSTATPAAPPLKSPPRLCVRGSP